MNSITIIGNLTRDPETKQTSSGKNVCNFTVAVNRRQKKSEGNNEADFFRVSAWEQTGDACQKYLSKGKKVAVRGSVSAHAYADKDGNPAAQLEVFAMDVEFLSGRDDGQQGGSNAYSAPAPAQAAPFGDLSDLPF